MSIISRLTTWSIGQVLKAADLNGEFNNITNLLNNLDAATTAWTNVKTNALAAKGTTTNDNATTGNLGEVLSASVLRSAAAAISGGSGAVNNITSLSVTAGDWDAYAMVGFTGSGFTATTLQGGISLTTGAMPAADTSIVPNSSGEVKALISGTTIAGINDYAFPFLKSRISVATPTTYYLVAGASFSVATPSIYGSLILRRVR